MLPVTAWKGEHWAFMFEFRLTALSGHTIGRGLWKILLKTPTNHIWKKISRYFLFYFKMSADKYISYKALLELETGIVKLRDLFLPFVISIADVGFAKKKDAILFNWLWGNPLHRRVSLLGRLLVQQIPKNAWLNPRNKFLIFGLCH